MQEASALTGGGTAGHGLAARRRRAPLPPAPAKLRELMVLYRKDVRGVTQAAAAERAGLSAVWWRQVEAGAGGATVQTLARMCHALGIPAAELRGLHLKEVAAEVKAREKALGAASPYTDPAERYLDATPGLSQEHRVSLIAFLRTLRQVERMDPLSRAMGRRVAHEGR